MQNLIKQIQVVVLSFVIVLINIFGCRPVVINAVDIDNDGKARDNPYGDSKLPASFDAPYYDCYVPYDLTTDEVGGFKAGNTIGNAKISSVVVQENTFATFSGYPTMMNPIKNYYNGATSDGWETLKSADGTVFYIMAIQKFFYNCSTVKEQGFPDWGSEFGQVVDVILTDGTVIHFIADDSNAEEHTNGGVNGQSSLYNPLNPMKLNQYRNINQAIAAKSIELWCSSQDSANQFAANYKIGKGVSIAYYRMYKLRIADGVKRNSGVPSEVSYSLGSTNIKQGEVSSNNEKVTANAGPISEDELTGMPKNVKYFTADTKVDLPTRANLSTADTDKIVALGDSIELRKQVNIVSLTRQILMTLGYCILAYGILLFVAYLFDRANSLFEKKLVTILTLGRIQIVSPLDTPPNRDGIYDYKHGLLRIILIIALGGIVVSEVMVKPMFIIIYWIQNLFTKF